MVAIAPAPVLAETGWAATLEFEREVPPDLAALLQPAGVFVTRVERLSDPMPRLRQRVADLARAGAQRRRELAGAWQTLVDRDGTTRVRIAALRGLVGLRVVAGTEGLRLWDPRLERIAGEAEAALAASQLLAVQLPDERDGLAGPEGDDGQAQLAAARAVLAEEVGTVGFLQGLVLLRGRADLAAVADTLEVQANRSSDVSVAARQAALARELRARLHEVTRALDPQGQVWQLGAAAPAAR